MPRVPVLDGTVTISGRASTGDVDHRRVKFNGWAFSNECLRRSGFPFPPLLWNHDADALAGEITALRYDADGQLEVSADVVHERAKGAGGFSLGTRLDSFEIKNADSPNFYVLVTSALITELSLVDCPANPRSLVRSRERAVMSDYRKAQNAASDLLIARVQRLQQALHDLRPVLAGAPSRCPALPEPPPPQHLIKAGPALVYGSLPHAMLRRKQTSFSRLVSQLPVGDAS